MDTKSLIRYHLKDVIVGKIYFLLVRIKIKHMELSIIRRETTGAPPNQYNESETITKFEIMDGAPVRGETIPIRLFLGGFELTPTFRDGKQLHSEYGIFSLDDSIADTFSFLSFWGPYSQHEVLCPLLPQLGVGG